MKTHSVTEENYLKAIYTHSVEGEPVSTNTLSKYLSTSPASVTDMLKKLGEKGLALYQPYKGASLTQEGTRVALRIIRKHRLWEVFLVKTLNFSWDRVHDTAEQLEHINSPELIRKLDEFLGYPKFDPHGDPIPSEDGEFQERTTMILCDVKPGETVVMAGVLLHTPEFLRYLDRLGLNIGTEWKVKEKISFDNSVVMQSKKRELILSGEASRQVLMMPLQGQ